MSPAETQLMIGAVQDSGSSTTLNVCSGARAGRCKRMTKEAELFMTCAKMMRIKRGQHRSLMH